jgi:hypothetical protein
LILTVLILQNEYVIGDLLGREGLGARTIGRRQYKGDRDEDQDYSSHNRPLSCKFATDIEAG